MRKLWSLLLALLGCGREAPPQTLQPTPCETYCGLAMIRCTNNNLLYPSLDTCYQTCATLPTDGASADTAGNTLQCRLTWIIAANIEPFFFCRNASASGGTACN